MHRDVSGIEFPVERRGAGRRVVVYDIPRNADEAVADDEFGGMLGDEEVDERRVIAESGQRPEGAFAACFVAGEKIRFGYHRLAFPHARQDEPIFEEVAERILHAGYEGREGPPWLLRFALQGRDVRGPSKSQLPLSRADASAVHKGKVLEAHGDTRILPFQAPREIIEIIASLTRVAATISSGQTWAKIAAAVVPRRSNAGVMADAPMIARSATGSWAGGDSKRKILNAMRNVSGICML